MVHASVPSYQHCNSLTKRPSDNWRNKRRLLPFCCLACVWHLPRPSRSRHIGDVAEKRLGTVKRATKKCNLFCSVAVEQMCVQLATFKPVWQQIRLLQVAKICNRK